MENKKGFTLIEILAIIVILVIILAISVPRVLVSINESSKKAFTSDVDQFVGIAKLEYNEKLSENKEDIWYYFENGKQTNVQEEGNIHFKGETPLEGYILVTGNGNVELKLVSHDGKWCASKELEDKKPIIDKCDIKEKESIDLIVNTQNSTQSITVIVSPSDLSTYYYQLDDGKISKSYENIKVYNKLKKNKEYTITVKGCRKNETVCKSTSVKVKLPDIDAPTYNVENIPEDQESTNGWALSRTVTIKYNQEKTTDYNELINQYIYASTVEELNSKINEGKWEICSEVNCTLPTFTSDAYIISRITDGYNIVSNSVMSLTNFDTENPTAPVITGGSTSWTNGSRTISVSTASRAKSGIKKYQYYKSTSSTELTGGSWKDCTTSGTSQKFETNGEYYIFFRAQSYIGKYSDASNVQVVKIDKTAPSCGSWTGQSTSWTNQNRTISLNCSDSESGCTAQSYNVKTYTSGTTKAASLSYTIKDNVGNSKVCSSTVNVYVDKTPPTCTSSGGSNSWTNNSRTLIGTCTDNSGGSGCKGNASWLINWQGNWTGLSPGTVYDNAGNATTCPANQTVRIDKGTPTAPVITGGSTSWKNYNQIIWITTPSSSFSGISRYQYYESTSYSSLTGGSWKNLYNNAAGVTTSGLDVAYYHSAYGDLINAFGGNVTRLNDHYILYGKGEGRSASNSGWLRTSQNISTNGVRYVFFRAVNNAGTVSLNSNYKQTSIDTILPIITWSPSSSTSVVNTPIYITCSDSLSGPASAIICDSNGCGTTSPTYAQVISGDENSAWALEATCTDNAGNPAKSPKTYNVQSASSSGSGGGSTPTPSQPSNPCRYKYYGGYSGSQCSKDGGTMVSTSHCSGSYSTCCRIWKCN